MPRSEDGSVETVLVFLDAINARDPHKIAQLVAEDDLFIDSPGQSVVGREKMRAGWRRYYAMCPDDWVTHEGVLQNKNAREPANW